MDVKSIRKGLGLTQAEFAARLGISHAYVGHIETGVRKPSIKLAARIGKLAGIDAFVEHVAAQKVAEAQGL